VFRDINILYVRTMGSKPRKSIPAHSVLTKEIFDQLDPRNRERLFLEGRLPRFQANRIQDPKVRWPYERSIGASQDGIHHLVRVGN
jgi:hypothetical protein